MNAVVMNTTVMLSQTASVKQNPASKDEQGFDFENLMMEKISTASGTAESSLGKVQSDVRNDVKTENSPRQIEKKPDENDKIVQNGEKEASDGNKLKDISQEDEDRENINRDEVAAALNAMDKISQNIADMLGISIEELQNAMDALSMGASDLLDRNSIAQLILSLNNTADISDMLLDNGMYDQLNQICSMIEDVLSESGLSLETAAGLLEKAGNADASDSLAASNDEDVSDLMENDGTEAAQATGNAEGKEAVLRNEADEAGEEEGETEGETDNSSELRSDRTSGRNETGRISTEHFLQNLEKAADSITDIDGQAIDVRDIAQQIVEQIKVRISPENTSMEMRLNPDNLGRVAIAITSKNGVMTAEIRTENQSAREAIESQLQILKESIQERGLKVEAIEVRVSDFNFADSKNSEKDAYSEESSSRRRNGSIDFDDPEGTEGISEAARNARELLENAGSTVSYRI